MKKIIKELTQKDAKELIKEEKDLREEIAKLSLEYKVNPSKDTNSISKKKKILSQILTVLKEKTEK